MTKRELIEALAEFPDDAEVVVFWSCGCGVNALEGIVDLNPNGLAIQLNSDSGRESVDAAWQENLRQNAKVRARREGRVDEHEWRSARREKARARY